MNHDKATPRITLAHEPARQIKEMWKLIVNGNLCGWIRNKEDAELLNAAVSAWDDPEALRERIKELEG